MTRKPARTRLAPDDRRAQLVEHAIGCFADHGIARATQAQVAARAGVSVSAVYFYFRTRADLVSAVLDAIASTIVTMVAEAVARPGMPEDVLAVLAGRTADMAVEQPDTVRVWLDWSTGVRADVWPQFLSLQRGCTRWSNRCSCVTQRVLGWPLSRQHGRRHGCSLGVPIRWR